MAEDELKETLKSAASLAEVAKKQGVEVNTVINLLVKAETERLQEQLSAGQMTQDKYDSRIADLVERITQQVNGEFPAKPERKTKSEG
ncbi:hypothetical protein [Paenibacillus bouchesdurhonensis]|uniref:hypothetical protein n=1 Tax=Paenibacillus bouchesdurhonensis TaxID=1870990 RepID=UPI000DA60359|nr:hypothetical protein [Paenibacillus bouchesdurhonensis]